MSMTTNDGIEDLIAERLELLEALASLVAQWDRDHPDEIAPAALSAARAVLARVEPKAPVNVAAVCLECGTRTPFHKLPVVACCPDCGSRQIRRDVYLNRQGRPDRQPRFRLENDNSQHILAVPYNGRWMAGVTCLGEYALAANVWANSQHEAELRASAVCDALNKMDQDGHQRHLELGLSDAQLERFAKQLGLTVDQMVAQLRMARGLP